MSDRYAKITFRAVVLGQDEEDAPSCLLQSWPRGNR